METLFTPYEVDRLLRYRRGRITRLARSGKVPFVTLPDGELRFTRDHIKEIVGFDLIAEEVRQQEEVAHA